MMDATTIGIALGIALAGGYALLRAWGKQSFELSHTVLIFLAAFTVPGGIALIAAGFVGDAKSLPSSWREHVTVAGIVAIGLAVHYVATTFRDCIAAVSESTNSPKGSAKSGTPD
jgi:hypothetical protein